MNSKEFIQAIEDKKVLVNKNGELIEKKIYCQKLSDSYIFCDYTIAFFCVFDEVRERPDDNIALYLKGYICGEMSPESWVIA